MWLLIPILFYTIAFLLVRHIYSYWRRKGFPHEKSNLTWAFLKQIYKREFHYADAICDAYNNTGKERFVGIYFLFHPTLLIRDLLLARDIMENPGGHINDSKWDYVRGYRKFNIMEKISPTFNDARLDAMFRIIAKVGDDAMNHLNLAITPSDCNTSDGIDMQNLLRTYSVNIIANLVYGLENDLFKETNSVFQQYLNYSIRQSVVNSYSYNRIPKKSSLTYRLRDIIRQNVKRREEGGIVRQDILQVLVKFRNGNDIDQKEKISWHIENIFEREKLLSIKKVSNITEHLLEKCILTMASTAVFALYEILQQPDLKAKIIDELTAHLQVNDDQSQLTYDGVKQLKLMDLCIQETMRKYPSAAVIERICRKDFQMPDSKHILSEGKAFMIPLLSIQRDEKYFEDPLSFKPQRFLHGNNGIKGNCFVSFGLGAKTFVAQNLVKVAVKCVLIKLFLNFHMEPVQENKFEICYNSTPFIQSKEGFKVKLKPRKIKLNL